MTARAGRANSRKSKARRPAPRIVDVALEGEFDGWTARARADFPARVLSDLQSGMADRVIDALESIILEHDLPDSDGNVAEHLGDVDPYDGLMKVGAAVIAAIQALPPR